MDSFPGGFPGLYPTSSPDSSNIIPFPYGNQERSRSNLNDISPQTIALSKCIRSKKRQFKNDLISIFDNLCFVYFFTCYLYDCSLLILISRSLSQLLLMALQYSPFLQGFFSKASGKKSTFNILIITTVLTIVSHLTTKLPTPNDDGYVYGHHTLQAIGQHQLSNHYWLLSYDFVIFFLQLTVYSTQFSSKRALHARSTVEDDHDGYQGTIKALRIPVVESLNMHCASISELKEDERLNEENSQRLASQIESLLNGNGDTVDAGYGATNQRDSSLNAF